MSDVRNPDQFAVMHEEHQYEGIPGERTHITRSERGTVPTYMLAEMPGVSGEVPGEHRTMKGERWEGFKQDIATHGIKSPIFITVDYNEPPHISEGNHRRDAALELGLTHVPVEVRYFGHAEQQGTLAQRNQHYD